MDPLGQRFQAYVSHVTDMPVTWGARVDARLPQYLAHRYEAYRIRVDRRQTLAIVLIADEPPPPLVLQKQVHQLMDLLGTPSDGFCLVAEQIPPYLRRRLVEMRMPFVIPGRQLYWPALGSVETLQRARRTNPRPVDQLAPVAQQLLIAMLLARLPRPVTVSGAANALRYTPMSASRAVKELEGAALAVSNEHGRLRTIALGTPPAETWAKALPMLRNPVIETVRIKRQDLPGEVCTAAGESALAEESDLAAPLEPVFAIASKVWTKTFRDIRTIPTVDEGTCRLELWRYAPDVTAERGRADPLSLFLSLRDNADDRVQLALETMMKRMPW
jgi:hypothetical protein